MSYLSTAECVSAGHPDKVCDQISDAVLDAHLNLDPAAKVAVTCVITKGKLLLTGKIQSAASVDEVEIAKKVLARARPNLKTVGFQPETAHYQNTIDKTSADNFPSYYDDEALVTGYATAETPQLLPFPYVIARGLMVAHEEYSKKNPGGILLPGAKVKVSLTRRDDTSYAIESIDYRAQHHHERSATDAKKCIMERLILPELKKYTNLQFSHNVIMVRTKITPVHEGSAGTIGASGRQLSSDTYGGLFPSGMKSDSGKDGLHTSRVGAHLARHIAKQVVWSGIADKCKVEIEYAPGIYQPKRFTVDTLNTGIYDDAKISKALEVVFDMRRNKISELFEPNKPDFEKTAMNGPFTDSDYPWERKNDSLIEKLIARLALEDKVREPGNRSAPKVKDDFDGIDIQKHKASFPKGGYGKFPYIILKPKIAGPALMMQIPIHLLAKGEAYRPDDHKGTIIENLPDEILRLENPQKFEAVLPRMKVLTEKAVQKLKTDQKEVVWACVVLNEDTGHYLMNGEWKEKNIIPTGGTLHASNLEPNFLRSVNVLR